MRLVDLFLTHGIKYETSLSPFSFAYSVNGYFLGRGDMKKKEVEHEPSCAINASMVADEFAVMGCTCGADSLPKPTESMEQGWEIEWKQIRDTGVDEPMRNFYDRVEAFIHKVRQEAVDEFLTSNMVANYVDEKLKVASPPPLKTKGSLKGIKKVKHLEFAVSGAYHEDNFEKQISDLIINYSLLTDWQPKKPILDLIEKLTEITSKVRQEAYKGGYQFGYRDGQKKNRERYQSWQKLAIQQYKKLHKLSTLNQK